MQNSVMIVEILWFNWSGRERKKEEKIMSHVDDFFDTYVYGWMIGDLQKAKSEGLNYLVTLGLSVYTEILGGISRESFKKNESRINYETFLPFLGESYLLVDSKLTEKGDSLYHRVRCGLVHEYFMRGKGAVFKESSPDIKDGIIYYPEDDSIQIIVDNYLADFKKGAKKLHKKMKGPQTVVLGEMNGSSGDMFLWVSGLIARNPEISGRKKKNSK